MERVKGRTALARDAQAVVRGGGVRELELRVVRRVPVGMMSDSGEARVHVSTSAGAVAVFRALWGPNMDLVEEMWVLLLDRGMRTIGAVRLSSGGMNATMCDSKLVFGAAVVAGASGIILAHNHPSGMMRPSEEDIRLTRRIVEGGRLLDIAVQDHVILTTDGYYSFADNGMM